MELDLFQEDEEQEGLTQSQKIIYAGAAVGLLISLAGVVIYSQGLIQLGGSLILVGVITGFFPFGIISFLKDRALREMENQFPAFLKEVAESKRGGMTLIDSFESAKESDYGRLNREIEKIHNQLTWGIPFPVVMKRFSERMGDSQVIQQSTSILLQSFKSGGNITDTIDSIAEDSSELKRTVQEKNSRLKQQIYIIYLIYFIFIGITIGIYWILSELMGFGTPGGGAISDLGAAGLGDTAKKVNFCSGDILLANPVCEISRVFGFVPQNVTDFSAAYSTERNYGNMAYYKSILFSMLVIQGICTGAVAGKIKDGAPSAGIKHMMIMIPIAVIVFFLTIGQAGV